MVLKNRVKLSLTAADKPLNNTTKPQNPNL